MGNFEKISGDELRLLFDVFSNYSDNDTAGEDCCAVGDVCDLASGREFEATTIVVLYLLAFVVGVLGNGLLLLVLVQNRRTWSVTDTFILHLAVADVLMLVTLPTWAAQAVRAEGWIFGTALCKITGAVFMVRSGDAAKGLVFNDRSIFQTFECHLKHFFFGKESHSSVLYHQINFYCGIFLLGCISLDRYLSIVHATHMYSRRNPWAIQISCMAAWLFSLLLSISDLIFLEAVEDPRRNQTKCVRNYLMFAEQSDELTSVTQVSSWQLASRLIYHLVCFLLPSAVMIFCYACILRRLRCGSQSFQKQRAIRVIVAVVVVFFLCWTPYNVALMVDTFHPAAGSSDTTCGMQRSLQKAMAITSSVGYLHCSLNPILYAFVGVKFRRQLLAILRSLGCKVKITATLHSTASSRRSSFWSESAETSNSVAI